MSLWIKEDAEYGFSCLRCKAITRSSIKVMVPGDDNPTYLTCGQREDVYCPVCQTMKSAEFVEIINSNRNRVVDAMGRPVFGANSSNAPINNPYGSNLAVTAPGVPMMANGNTAAAAATATGGMMASSSPARNDTNSNNNDIYKGFPPIPASPNQSNNNNNNSTPALMTHQDFEKHLGSLADDDVRKLKRDLQEKLHSVEQSLQERRKCIICCDRDKSVVLLPCKHMSLCSQCSEKVTECPVCKKKVEDRIMPFMS